jgi:hypothetical protein
LTGETIFESGPGLRNWITLESADGFGMAVAARVGGRFRVGMGCKVSEGIDSEIDSGVGLASGCVGVANSKVGKGKLGVAVGSGRIVGMGVSGMRTRVGSAVNAAGPQAVTKNSMLRVRKKRWNIIRL